MKRMINITEFNEMVAGIKAMKADLVYVCGNMLYGTDNSFNTLKTYMMNCKISVEPFTVITKSLSTDFYNSIIDTYITIDFDENTMYCSTNRINNEKAPVINATLHNKIQLIINSLNNSINIPNINTIDFGDITNDINLERIKNIKSGDGAVIYNPNGNSIFGMYLYSGAIPMTKSDKLGLRIYDLGNTFIANYIISKKKSNPVNLYFRFVKLQNNMYRA